MGIVGTVVALALCAQMLRDVRRSRTRLAVWELAMLAVHRRQAARPPTPFEAVVGYFHEVYRCEGLDPLTLPIAKIAKAFRDAGFIK